MKNNNIPYEAKLKELPECWIFDRKRYIYHRGCNEMSTLPKVKKDLFYVLDDLGIPFSLIGNYCYLWNPNKFEKKELSLPMYIIIGNTYRYIHDYTDYVYTDETLEAAYKLFYQKVLPKISCSDLYSKIKDILSNGEAFKVVNGLQCPVDLNIEKNQEYFIIIPIKRKLKSQKKVYSGWNLVADINQIIGLSDITLNVPAGIKGLVLGYKGWQIKELTKKLDVDKIYIKEL